MTPPNFREVLIRLTSSISSELLSSVVAADEHLSRSHSRGSRAHVWHRNVFASLSSLHRFIAGKERSALSFTHFGPIHTRLKAGGGNGVAFVGSSLREQKQVHLVPSWWCADWLINFIFHAALVSSWSVHEHRNASAQRNTTPPFCLTVAPECSRCSLAHGLPRSWF